MRELCQGGVDHGLRGQLGDGEPSDGGGALTVVVEDSVEGHGVESEERSVYTSSTRTVDTRRSFAAMTELKQRD